MSNYKQKSKAFNAQGPTLKEGDKGGGIIS